MELVMKLLFALLLLAVIKIIHAKASEIDYDSQYKDETHPLSNRDVIIKDKDIEFENKAVYDPWMVTIYQLSSIISYEIKLCHGSLINNRYVLTTADCFPSYQLTPDEFVVRYLCDKLSNRTFGVEEIIRHPDHRTGYFYDNIAIIKLNETLENVTPLRLPSENDDYVEKNSEIYRENYLRCLSFKRHKETQRIITNDECSVTYHERYTSFLNKGITSQVLCLEPLESINQQLCYSDPGSPIIVEHASDPNPTIIGIVPKHFCTIFTPVWLYVRVSSFVEWIYSVIEY